MQSISMFKCKGVFPVNKLNKLNVTSKKQYFMNGQNEMLTKRIKVVSSFNTKQTSYYKFLVSLDVPVPIKARVFNRPINSVVVNTKYVSYIDKNSGTIICFANKKNAEDIINFMSSHFKLKYKKKQFGDLHQITKMPKAQNVSNTQFKKIHIQTISSGSLSGDNLTHTNLYKTINRRSHLSNVSVAFLLNNGKIAKFSVSSKGSVVLQSTLHGKDVYSFIDLLETL